MAASRGCGFPESCRVHCPDPRSQTDLPNHTLSGRRSRHRRCRLRRCLAGRRFARHSNGNAWKGEVPTLTRSHKSRHSQIERFLAGQDFAPENRGSRFIRRRILRPPVTLIRSKASDTSAALKRRKTSKPHVTSWNPARRQLCYRSPGILAWRVKAFKISEDQEAFCSDNITA